MTYESEVPPELHAELSHKSASFHTFPQQFPRNTADSSEGLGFHFEQNSATSPHLFSAPWPESAPAAGALHHLSTAEFGPLLDNVPPAQAIVGFNHDPIEIDNNNSMEVNIAWGPGSNDLDAGMDMCNHGE
jgi:hypothetical protein